MSKQDQNNLTITNQEFSQEIELRNFFTLFDNISGSKDKDFNKQLEKTKEKIQITSRRIFESYDKDKTVEEFKEDLNFFLYFGDFIKSIKVHNLVK